MPIIMLIKILKRRTMLIYNLKMGIKMCRFTMMEWKITDGNFDFSQSCCAH